MNNKVLAVIFGALLMLSGFMAIFSMLTLPQPDAFLPEELTAPGQHTFSGLQPEPTLAGDWIHSPDVTILISAGNVYAGYGGSIRVEVRNNGTRDIFVQKVAFEWTSYGYRVEKNVHQYLAGNESYEIKALAIPGTSTPGDKTYQLSISLMAERNNGWYQISMGTDEWVDFSEHTMEVLDLPDDNEHLRVDNNPRIYYKRVNELVDFESEAVASAAENATSGLGSSYNIAKVCAIFDWLDDNCVYTEDPQRDNWYSPDTLLETLEGDCEDYAMLIAAMVQHIGGNSRVYLTHDHAYAAVYVGNTSADFDTASAEVKEYYGTDLEVHAMVDETGYWLNADPLGSFYAGGFAVGQSPTEQYNGTWNTTFEESNQLYAIDVTGIDLGVPIYYEPNVWLGMMLVFGFITVFSILAGSPKKQVPKVMCHICAQEIHPKERYSCPTCKTTYHSNCAHTQAYCMTCQQPILFPPPPPPVA